MQQLTPLPVDGLDLDFRELDAGLQRVATYALLRQLLARTAKVEDAVQFVSSQISGLSVQLEKLELDPLTVAEREEIMTALSSATTASNDTQERFRKLIAGLPTP
jgi:hypothetical protein